MPPETTQESTPNTPPTPSHPPGLSQIRTFQGDVASALSRQNESLVSIQQSEELRRRVSGVAATSDAGGEAESKHKDFLFLFIGTLFFLIVGSLGAWYGYKTYMQRTAPPILAVPESRLISPTKEVTLNLIGLDRLTFGSAFETQIADTAPNELKHVVLRWGVTDTTPLVSSAEFMTLIESRAAGSLVRAFDDAFMIGALGEDQFIIIKLVSFENAFAGMLAWEENMAEDLAPIFGNLESVKAIGPASVFKDVIVRNKDVRVLESTASTTEGMLTKPVLLYSFFDNNLLIITESLETLQTLIERLTRERLSR